MLDFLNFIAQNARLILEDISSQNQGVKEPNEIILAPATTPLFESFNIDIDSSKITSGGSVIDAELDDEQWAVLTTEGAVSKIDPPPHATFLTILPNDDDIDGFVAQTYLAILRRPADQAGFNVYTTLLRENKISRGRFLKVLLTSEEASNLSQRYIIVAARKVWHSQSNKTSRADTFTVSIN